MKMAIPLGLSQFAILIYFNSDVIFLGFTHGDKVEGLYSTAYSAMMLIAMMLGSSLFSTYFPVLSRSYNEPVQAANMLGDLLRLMIWLDFPVAALGWAVGRYLIVLL